MSNFSYKLKQFLHDPPDKCLDIPTHEKRAEEYAAILQISGLKEASEADKIASSMERTLLPKLEKFGLKKTELYQKFTEIRHPLSKNYIPIQEINKKEVFSKVKEAFSELGKKVEDISDDKEKFLFIWRNLLYEIQDKVDSEFKKYLSILPADTRVPDHSIWEHLKITSAIGAFEGVQNNSLFLFSIGPVQSFIFQARKTQDFFMGSFLLSYLTFTGIIEIIEKYGPTNVIYPDLFGQPLMDWYMEKVLNMRVKNSYFDYITQPTIPNRFVAIIPQTDPEKIKELANKIEEKIRKGWIEIAQKVLSEFKIKCEEKIFKNHITTFPEIYWVTLPFKKAGRDITAYDFKDFFSDNGIVNSWKELWKFAEQKSEHPPKIGLLYQLAYSCLEKEMGARKNLRDFIQTEEESKKCHICGEREGVVRANIGSLRQGKYIDQSEGLCLLCFTKRALDVYLKDQVSEKFKNFSFPSTSEIAISKFKEKALKNAKDKFENYIKVFKKEICTERGIFEQVKTELLPKLKKYYPSVENIDGEWFFKENLREELIKKNLGIKRIGDLKEVRDKLGELTKEVKLSDKDKYYAVILLDGDYMGKWLSGELLPKLQYVYNSEIWEMLPEEFKKELLEISKKINNERKFLSPAIHATISHALRNYSIEFVRQIVEVEHLGKLVYSGGDDVLAFVTIYELFDVMRKLRAAFSGHIKFDEKGDLKVDWSNDKGFVEKDGMYLLTMGKDATASCGVAIAHYKAPLRMVLLKAQQMEKKAKDLNGKDAFAMCLMKHSGEEREAVCKWRYGEIDVLERLDMLRRLFSKISDRFIYTLRDEFKRVKEKDGSFRLEEGILVSEIRRVIKRSVQEKEILKKIFEEIQLLDLFWKLPERNIDNFLNLLEISSFTSLEE